MYSSPRTITSALALLLSASGLFAQDTSLPKLDGYVSSLQSQNTFVVDGRPVERWERTGDYCANPRGYHLFSGPQTIALGDHVLVFGSYNKKKQAVVASALCKVAWPDEKVTGAAVLERMTDQQLLVDGRLLVVEAKSIVKTEGSRHGLADAEVNDWVRYIAVAQPDGSYRVREITIAPNTTSPLEEKLRDAKFLEFTPPDMAAKRNGTVKFSRLSRRYKLPANDEVERLARVGSKLIPPYQRSLAAGDPARIDFHFYPADSLKMSTCLSTATGNVFVPSALLKRLPEERDLAAILATCVADLIEKQPVLLLRKGEATTGVLAAAETAGLFVPGLGLATLAGSSIYSAHLEEQLRHQSARVSLDLLEAAGYAPEVAPHAEELAEAKHLPLKSDAQPSERVGYLYLALAEWEHAHHP